MEKHGPSRDWLKKAADAEDATRSTSVGGLAADLGMHAMPMEPMAVKLELLGGPRDGGHTEVIAYGSKDANGLPVYCLPLDVIIITDEPDPIGMRSHKYVLYRAKREVPQYKYEPEGGVTG